MWILYLNQPYHEWIDTKNPLLFGYFEISDTLESVLAGIKSAFYYLDNICACHSPFALEKNAILSSLSAITLP